MIDQVEELKRLALSATPGPWKWWTSNSVKRITGPDGEDGGVLSAYVHAGYADLRVSAEDQAYIESANPSAILELIEQLERWPEIAKTLASENAELRKDAERRAGVTLTAQQLLDALNLAAPDRDEDPDQMETEVTIQYMDNVQGDDGILPAGLFLAWTDYLGEGCIPLFDIPEKP